MTLTTACLLAFSGTSAHAQAPPAHAVFVAPLQPLGEGGASLAGGKFVESLKSNLGGRASKLKLISEAKAPEGRLAGPFGGGSAGTLNLQDARTHVKVGEGLLKTGESEKAMNELGQALKLFEANLAFIKDESELTEVHLLFAAAAFQAGYEDEGEKALRQVLIMKPDLNVKERGFPPLFKRLVGKFQRRLKKVKPGVMAISSDPSPATVYVDGVQLGETPLEIDDVLPGAHYVRLLRPMMGVWAHKIDWAPSKGRAELAIKLPTIGGEAQQSGDRAAADAAAAKSVEELGDVLATGMVDRNAKDKAYEVALRVGATHVLFGVVAPGPRSYGLRTYLLRAEPKAAVDLGIVEVDPELLELGVMVHEVAERVVAALETFPETGAVTDVAVAPALTAPPPQMAAAPAPPAPPAANPALAPSAAASGLSLGAPSPNTAGPVAGSDTSGAPVAVSPLQPSSDPTAQSALSPPTEPALSAQPSAPFGPLAIPPPPSEPTGIGAAQALGVSDVPPPVEPTPENRPGLGRWLWPTVGAVVIAGGTVAALLLIDTSEEQPRSFRTEVAW